MKFKIPWTKRSHDFLLSNKPLTQGKYLQLFEKGLKKYLNIREGDIFAVDSGTSALELVASLLRIKPGDEIIIPAHTFCASAIPFLRRGAEIVWADIDYDTWVISYEDVKKKITMRTKAIMLVHLYGLPCNIDKFREFNIPLIEDAAQSFGAIYKDEKVGVLTDFGIFSFHAQKNMTTLGEGGAIYVKDKKLAEKVPLLRNFGQQPFNNQTHYWIPATVNVTSIPGYEIPFKYTISEIQCLIGYKLLKRIDTLNKKRRERYYKFYYELNNLLKLQTIPKYAISSHHLLPAYYYGNRDDLIKLLAYNYGIQAIVQYYPLYRQDLFKNFGYGEAECPYIDNFFAHMLSFPFHVNMKDKDFEYMIKSTHKALLII